MSYPNLTAAQLPYRGSIAETVGTSGANPTYSGGAWNETAGSGKLWLPIWSGEVIHAYDQYNSFEPLVTSKTIASGTTMEFPITGTVGLEPAWAAGQELIGGADNKATTFTVTLDKRPMAAHFETDNIDMMLTQWEWRSELARQAGMTLSNTRDKQIFSYLVQAATNSQMAEDVQIRGDFGLDGVMYSGGVDSVDGATIRFASLGNTSASAALRADAALGVLESIEKFVVHLQENDIDHSQVYCAVTPQAFMDIRALGVARDYTDFDDGGTRPYFGGTADMGGLGMSLNQGMGPITASLNYMGVTIIKSNHIVQTDLSGADGTADALGEAKYNLDFLAGKVKGVIWTPEAVASLKLQGVKVDNVEDVRRNTHFTVASMMGGTGVLRPECAALLTGLDTSAGQVDNRTMIRDAAYLDYTQEYAKG